MGPSSRIEHLENHQAEAVAPHPVPGAQVVALGTKAESLARIGPQLTKAVCLPLVSFTVEEWERDPGAVIAGIRRELGLHTLVVRSSALAEDNEQTSNAGAFCSVLGVAPLPSKLASAIRRVIASYGDPDPRDQILVQPQLHKVALSGVVFTRDIHHGAPYYVVNAESSGTTDAITGGSARNDMTHYVRRVAAVPRIPTFLRAVVAAARELEQLTGREALDIEFAIDRAGGVYVFQVRPLVTVQPARPTWGTRRCSSRCARRSMPAASEPLGWRESGRC